MSRFPTLVVAACAFTAAAHLSPPDARAQEPGSSFDVASQDVLVPGDPDRGAAIFRERGRCIECHRFRGEGSVVRGPSLDAHWASGPALAERLAEQARPRGYRESVPGDASLLQSLLEPGAVVAEGAEASMPAAHGPLLRLDRQDLADLLSWMNPGPGGPGDPGLPRWVPEIEEPGRDPWEAFPGGDVARGEDLFFRPDDAACSGCHVVRLPRLEARYPSSFWERGGLAGPELTRLALVASPERILESILRPTASLTQGFQNTLAVTHGERLFVGTLLADGEPGVLLMDAQPSGPEFVWLDRADLAEVLPQDSRMTHVFPELLDLEERLDVLAFLRAAALESAALGEEALPGQPLGARDPCVELYSGEWPASARPELLQRVPGVRVR